MKPFRIRLGWTRQREQPLLFGPDAQMQSPLWITEHPVGGVLAVGVVMLVYLGVPEIRPLLLGALVLGALLGFALWLKHR